MTAAMILISSGQFRRAIEILHQQGASELAIRLFLCCKQFRIDDDTLGQKLFDDYIDLMKSFGLSSIANDYRTTVVVWEHIWFRDVIVFFWFYFKKKATE